MCGGESNLTSAPRALVGARWSVLGVADVEDNPGIGVDVTIPWSKTATGKQGKKPEKVRNAKHKCNAKALPASGLPCTCGGRGRRGVGHCRV